MNDEPAAGVWCHLKMQIVETARSFDLNFFFYNAYHILLT
jgi:hypothetical protein